VSGTILEEIPQAAYFGDALEDDTETSITHTVQILQPESGVYQVTVMGIFQGPYELLINPYAEDGSIEPTARITGQASVGSTATYEVQYASAPGSVSPVFIPVSIDIYPGTSPNLFNVKSTGLTPVAILTTASFDASTVDPSSVRFGATGTEAAPSKYSLQDVNGDGKLDLVLQFPTQSTKIACGMTSGKLTGKTKSGVSIIGSDSIQTVGCK
jgi:hypothetical protein